MAADLQTQVVPGVKPGPKTRDIHIQPRRRKRTTGQRVAVAIIAVLLVIYSFVTILPFYFLFVRSFVPTVQSTTLWIWPPPPREPNLDAQMGSYSQNLSLPISAFRERFDIGTYLNPNLTFRQISEQYNIPLEDIEAFLRPYANYSGWMTVLTGGRFLRSTVATAVVVIVSVVVGGFLSAATGSVLSRFSRGYHMAIYRMYLLEMIIPPVMVILPLFVIISQVLHLQNTYVSLILFFIKGGAVPTLLFTSYIATLPKELMESVYVDGGNRHQYFFYIMLPLTKTAFAAFFAMRIPKYWNDLLHGYVFLNPEKYTLPPLVASLVGEFSTNFQALFSGLAVSVVPIIALYLVFNKLFLRAQLAGALKG